MTFIPSLVEFFSFTQKLLLGTCADKSTWQYDRRILDTVLQMCAFNCDLTYEPCKLHLYNTGCGFAQIVQINA